MTAKVLGIGQVRGNQPRVCTGAQKQVQNLELMLLGKCYKQLKPRQCLDGRLKVDLCTLEKSTVASVLIVCVYFTICK